MIISASRRTDIPTFYSEWFFNRIKERYSLVRNPINIHQVSKINLSPEVVDCIVFWTKNPAPMLKRIDELKDYNYYFQFTLTPYGKDIEQNVPAKNNEVIETFKKLSDKIGNERVIWRYDPILLNSKYTAEYHINCFKKIANRLKDYTPKCIISFIDFYPKIKKNMAQLEVLQTSFDQKRELAKILFEIASKCGFKMDTCAENIDFTDLGISCAKCIDDKLISKIIDSPISVIKDSNQRSECGCVASIDIGAYNTCQNGCRYCYANHSILSVKANAEKYNPKSPLLCSELTDEDVVKIREMKSLKENQLSLFH